MCEKTRGFGAESPAQVLLIGWNLPRVGRRRSEACIPCCQNGKVTKISQAPGWNCYSPRKSPGKPFSLFCLGSAKIWYDMDILPLYDFRYRTFYFRLKILEMEKNSSRFRGLFFFFTSLF